MLLVSDANIFIDFEAAGLLPELFQLPHKIVVPDVLYEQELSQKHPHLLRLGLATEKLDGQQVATAFLYRAKYKGTGVNDVLALVLAKSLECPLVTGDRALRDAALKEGVQLMGTLSLMEHLFLEGILDLASVESAYAKMATAGRRLPGKEIAAQMSRLKSGL